MSVFLGVGGCGEGGVFFCGGGGCTSISET